MNFFEHQRLAKKHSQRLIVAFVISTILLVLVTGLALIAITRVSGMCANPDQFFVFFSYCEFEWKILGVAAICVTSLIIGGSFLKHLEFKGDPDVIAKSIGATKIDPGATDHLQKRFINIVEEMAIASGVPIPHAYILFDDHSLNAFAAGFDLHHSLVAVTEGMLKATNREELQAVVAHEFSHIVHGDMNLSRQLIVTVNGISMISMFGAAMVRNMRFSRVRRSGRNNGAVQLLAFGMVIYVIGYVGLVISRLLKSSISRQREYLADASAVQYTRNPEALSSCFKKIMANGSSQLMEDKSRETFSHMFFSNAFFLSGHFFSTHPPLGARIRRLDRNFNEREFVKHELKHVKKKLDELLHTSTVSQNGSLSQKQGVRGFTTPAQDQSLMSAVGSLNDQSIDEATRLRESIHPSLERMIYDPIEAQFLIVSLFLSSDTQERTKQMMAAQPSDAHARKRINVAYSRTLTLSEQQKMTLFELGLSTLDHHLQERHQFLETLNRVVDARNKRSLEDFLLLEYCRTYLSPAPKVTGFSTLSDHHNVLSVLFQLIARLGTKDSSRVEELYLKAMRELRVDKPDPYEPSKLSASNIRKAFIQISTLTALGDRQRVLKVALDCVHADAVVTQAERRCMRLLTSLFGAPMPLCLQDRS
jgi:Zn-dependent protease with chaperone function